MSGFNTQTFPSGAARHKPRTPPATAGSFNPSRLIQIGFRSRALGWGAKRIAAELGCSKNTVKRWLRYGDWRPCVTPSRTKRLDGLADWLAKRFRRHRGNADVFRQELAVEKGVRVSLRTVERAVAPLRRELVAEARATVCFET